MVNDGSGGGGTVGQGEKVLTDAADLVQVGKGELDQIGNNLESHLSPTMSGWQGQGGMAFRKVFTSWLEKQRQITKTLDQFEASLRSAESTNITNDESQAASVNQFSGKLDAV